MLTQAHRMWGNQWAKITSQLPGRTENTVKNRWYSAVRFAKRHPSTNTVSNNSLPTESPSPDCITTPPDNASLDVSDVTTTTCFARRFANKRTLSETELWNFANKRPKLRVCDHRGDSTDGDMIPQLGSTTARQPSASQNLPCTDYGPLPPTSASSRAPLASPPDMPHTSTTHDETAATRIITGIVVAQALLERDWAHLQMLQSNTLCAVKTAAQTTLKPCEQEATESAETLLQPQEAHLSEDNSHLQAREEAAGAESKQQRWRRWQQENAGVCSACLGSETLQARTMTGLCEQCGEGPSSLGLMGDKSQNTQKSPISFIGTVTSAVPPPPRTSRPPRANSLHGSEKLSASTLNARQPVVYTDVLRVHGKAALHFDHAKQLLTDASTRAAGERPSYLLRVRSREEIRGAVFKEETQAKRPSKSDLWMFKGKNVFWSMYVHAVLRRAARYIYLFVRLIGTNMSTLNPACLPACQYAWLVQTCRH